MRRGSGRGLGAGAGPCGNRVGTGGDLPQYAPEFSGALTPGPRLVRGRRLPGNRLRAWPQREAGAVGGSAPFYPGLLRPCRPGLLCLPLGRLHVTYVDFTAEAWGETYLDCEGAEEISVHCGL